MTDAEFEEKVFERMKRLQDAREKNSIARHELNDIGQRLDRLGSRLRQTIMGLKVMPDGYIEMDGKLGQDGISSHELSEVAGKLSAYLAREEEIKELEDCLVSAGYGNLIGKT